MPTEKQKLRIIKYQTKCQDSGYEYIEHFCKKRNTFVKTECNKCNGINDFRSISLMNGRISCGKCLIIKYKNQCKNVGYEFIGKFRKNKRTYIKCKCLKCNLSINFECGALMKGQIRCNECLIIKYQNRCKELDYEFIKHFRKKVSTYIKCRCIKCNNINDFTNGSLMNNCVKCECKKKIFVRGFIYKITIGPYYYIGLTDTTIKKRYINHKNDCFGGIDNSKKYKIIKKELCRITRKSIDEIKEDFNKYVVIKQIAVINTSREDLKSLETELINLNNPSCLNSIN